MQIFLNTNAALITKVIDCFAAVEVTPLNDGIRRAFLACPGNAMSLTQLSGIVCALDNVNWTVDRQEDIRKALALLVRKGALRSRANTLGKIRVWEANY